MTLSFVRALLPAIVAAATLLTAHAALAAPTCQTRDGLTIRCGTQGAMPVGWSLPPEDRKVRSPPVSATQLLTLIGTLGLLFALIAFLPEFDGRSGRDWDKQEGDDEERASR
jgi:hypothetical protein